MSKPRPASVVLMWALAHYSAALVAVRDPLRPLRGRMSRPRCYAADSPVAAEIPVVAEAEQARDTSTEPSFKSLIEGVQVSLESKLER